MHAIINYEPSDSERIMLGIEKINFLVATSENKTITYF